RDWSSDVCSSDLTERMAHAYTPGLRVAARTRVAQTRRLPLKGKVLVEKGAVVTEDTVVARTELPGNVQAVKAASLLGVHQQDLETYMLKKVGDPVQKDEPIAMAKSFFGLFKSQVDRKRTRLHSSHVHI